MSNAADVSRKTCHNTQTLFFLSVMFVIELVPLSVIIQLRYKHLLCCYTILNILICYGKPDFIDNSPSKYNCIVHNDKSYNNNMERAND